jgi:hypothetical protein
VQSIHRRKTCEANAKMYKNSERVPLERASQVWNIYEINVQEAELE